jgi:cell division protein FtsB
VKNIFRSGVVLVLVISIIAVGRSIYGQLSKFKEIYEAERTVQKLSSENTGLKSQSEQGKTSAFIEGRARDKLGLQQPGETLYVVDMGKEQQEQSGRESQENWQIWVELLLR